MKYAEVLRKLRAFENPRNVEGMARFGIRPKAKVLGVNIPVLRKLAKEIGKDDVIASELWQSGIHEARLLAGLIADPANMTAKKMDYWVKSFDSWDVCDVVCMNCFDKTKIASSQALKWAKNDKEFVRRAGFALMACLAFHNKTMSDNDFKPFFEAIEKYAFDERNFVKKSVNWALRQIGKRNKALNKKALQVALRINMQGSKSSRWIASDAIRELRNPKILSRIK